MLKRTAIAFFICLLAGCSKYVKVSNQNLAFLYKDQLSLVEYSIFHQTDSISKLNFKVPTNILIYSKSNSNTFSCQFKFNYRLFSSLDSKLLVDSGTVSYVDTTGFFHPGEIIGDFDLKAEKAKSYLLDIVFTDVKRQASERSFINIEKQNSLGRQNFLIFDSRGKPLFENYRQLNDTVLISVNEPSDKLFVRFYSREFGLAKPPFLEVDPEPFRYAADSSFTIELKDDHFLLHLPKSGFYHVQRDSSSKEGLTVFVFPEGFPELINPEQLVAPLRYLTSKSEYDNMLLQQNKKAAVDNFWLSLGEDSQRSKELLRVYYKRCQMSNKLFSSFLEGWKTDRGMIYIVFGPPGTVYRNEVYETWVYGEENSVRAVTFSFVRVINPFTDNDFKLMRTDNYRTAWYLAVDTWRQGRIFND